MSADTFTVEALRVAVQSLPRSAVFFGEYGEGLVDLAFYVWHLQSGNTHVLVDLGLPERPADLEALQRTGDHVGPSSTFRHVLALPDALKAFGLEPGQIDTVLVTQPIVYHTGGLTRANVPRATVWLPRPGLVEFLVDPPGHPDPDFYFTGESWSYLRELSIERRLRAVEGMTEVMPGLSLEVTGGHHPGSAAVHVRTEDGDVILLETAFVQQNVSDVKVIGLAEDVATARTAITGAIETGARVIAIHEPANALEFPARRVSS